MQVLAAYVSDPGLRAESFEQVRGMVQSQLAQLGSLPMAVFQLNLQALLRNGDKRWSLPTMDDVKSAKPEDLKAILLPALARGAIEIEVVGDVTVKEAVEAVASTFGALPPRSTPPKKAVAGDLKFPAAAAVVLPHKGKAEQGIAAAAWPLTDVFAAGKQAAAQRLLAGVMQDRLKEILRERAGASYSVLIQTDHSAVFPGYGSFLAFADIPPAKAPLFYEGLAKILADLKKEPPTADEVDRARNPAVANFKQSQQTNVYWLGVLGQVRREPRSADVVRTTLGNLQEVSAAEIQKAANSLLVEDKMWKLLVQPAAAAEGQR
jgi:zinc protease